MSMRGVGLVTIDSPAYDRLVSQVDLIVTQQDDVNYGDYPAIKFICTTGKKEGDNWSDNPWHDIVGDEPLGNVYDLNRFLDKYYYLDILAVFDRKEETNVDGSEVVKNEIRVFPAHKYVENKPTTFKFKVFEADGTTAVTDATATVRFDGSETTIEYDAEEGFYFGEVYGHGKGILTVSKTGFKDYVETFDLSNNMTYTEVYIRQDDGYELTTLEIVLEAE